MTERYQRVRMDDLRHMKLGANDTPEVKIEITVTVVKKFTNQHIFTNTKFTKQLYF